MKLLSVDASGKTAACAVTDGDTVLADKLINTGLTHSQTLLPAIDETLKCAGIGIADIDEFAVTVGPGSFTGLRIGLSLVMGLASGKPIHPVPTLLAIAYNFIGENCIVIPVLDARRNQVYTAVFKSENGVISRLDDDSADSVENVLEKAVLLAKTDKVVFAGDGAYLFEKLIENRENICLAKVLFPTGTGISAAAKFIDTQNAKDIRLSYLRLSQAERELKEKKGK